MDVDIGMAEWLEVGTAYQSMKDCFVVTMTTISRMEWDMVRYTHNLLSRVVEGNLLGRESEINPFTCTLCAPSTCCS